MLEGYCSCWGLEECSAIFVKFCDDLYVVEIRNELVGGVVKFDDVLLG